MSSFATPPQILNQYTHPHDPSRPLFFLIDTVHIMKNIRNNWINKKPVQCMQYPKFEGSSEVKHASFDALKQLHKKEEHQLIKYGYSLTLKALYPTTIEKQNVKLALQVFNHNIVAALRQIGPKVVLENYEDTADYIEIICRWRDIVNVKTLLKGQRLHNKFQEPITKDSAHIFQFLEDFLKWLDNWQSLDNSFEKLTKETHHAIRHTTDGLLKIVRYCLVKKNYSFVLPGKLQTDKLEERFGKYRRQAGAQYQISVRQVFESESKLRMTSVLPLILKSKAYGDISITKENILTFIEEKESQESIKNQIPLTFQNICATIDESDIDDIEDNIWPPLIYVAGYAAYSVSKKVKCVYCNTFLKSDESSSVYSSLITETSRGGLCYPSEGVILSVTYAYLVLIKLLQIENDFLKEKNQKYILTTLSFETIINSLELELFIGHSCPDYNEKCLLKMLLQSVANILLKNYTKEHNDRATTRTMPHLKRIKPLS